MKLKELHLFGFKSFGDKTTIEFDQGITIIVGPNGSGKSNIFDAMKWVLGEQSVKSLRGNKMEDVIFAGSDMRKTLGMAEVSIILDNQEKKINLPYSEIKVTRRLYRSGESEYLINDNQCRLKDITEIFMDTGVGIDSYSIISQGEVDRIINAKPEERREIFEEAAGITKHRKRKEETLRRLETVESDMIRINDLLEEVKRQAASLERQAKKAEKYKILKEETDEIEIKLLKSQIKKLNEKYKKLIAEKEEIEKQINEENMKLKNYEIDFEKLKEEIVEKENVIKDKNNSFIIKQQEIKRMEDNLVYNNEKNKELFIQKENANKESIELVEKIEKVKIEIEGNDNKIKESNERILHKETELNKSNEELNCLMREIEKIVEDKKEKTKILDEISGKIIEIKNKITEREMAVKSIDEDINKLEVLKKQNEEKLHLVELELEHIEDGIKIKEEEIKNIKLKEEDLLKRKLQLKNDFEKINDIIKEQILIISKINSKYEFLNEMQKKMAGYSDIVKKVLTEFKMQMDNKETGVFDSISSIIGVENKYVKLIEKVFSSYLQAILVDNLDIIKEIFTIYEKEKGELLLLHNDILNSKCDFILSNWRKKINHKNIETYLPDLFSVNDKYKGIKILFYNIYVVADMEKANEVIEANKIDEQYYLLTNNGELISNYGIFRKVGGEAEIGTNLLTRTKEINEIRNEILLAKERLNSLNEEKNILDNRISKVELEIENLSLNYHNQYIEVVKDNERIKQKNEELKFIKQDIEKNITSLQTLKNYRNEIMELKGKLESEKLEMEVSFAKTSEEIKKIDEIFKIKQGDLNLKKEGINEFEKELIKEKSNLEFIISNKNMLEERKKEMNLKYESLVKEVENINAKLIELENERNSINEKIFKLKSEILNDENQIANLKVEFEKVKKQKDDLENFIKAMGGKREELRENLSELKMQINEISFEIKSLYQKIQENYKIMPEEKEIEALQIDEEEYKTLNLKVSENKEKMESIGLVNLVAIEEYNTVKQRMDFLQKQYDDLVASRENLKKIIKRINEESTERFTKAFEEIKVKFRQVFNKMMKGGEADVILVDKENVLESGIDIIAKPPGKKFQHINLLSGGEKAVTAISLLFAIFLIKASPFCIMDEVDAPLDDVNIIRFINFIKEFKEKTQFIIITHNKLTMEIADIIYGVSMERDGVSKIISVKFEKIDEFIK